jgi:serine phosphatase RsbU (regulator of sigma subunit)/anti-sigma regulatory factor (Ser/Thr protein kinase)
VTTRHLESRDARLSLLRRLAAATTDALTADQVARSALTTLQELPGVTRAGIAIATTGGRELRFASTDEDSLTPHRVRWCRIDGYADVPLVDAARTGRDLYAATPDELDVRYPGYASRQRELGVSSVAALALSTDSEQVGGLLVCFAEQQEFDAELRWLLSAFAAQVTQAMRNGLRHQQEHTSASQLQRSLLPRSLPDLPGLELGSYYRSGGFNTDVGGDWYDVLELPDGRVGLVVGDVMGKGIPAARLMAEVRSALRAHVTLDPSPSTVLERLDAFVSSPTGSGIGSQQLVTVAYGVVSADRSTLTIAVAGHPPPLVVDPGVGVEQLVHEPGSALGVGAGPWPETVVALRPRRLVLLYSNGLVETRTRDLSTGLDELTDHLRQLPARRCQPRELCSRIAQLMTDDHTEDDVALLATAQAPAGGVRRASTRLSEQTTAPGEARRFLRRVLTGWQVGEDLVDSAELCVSELVTNAVIHTGTAAELTARLDGDALTVLVRDGGGAGPVQQRIADGEDPMMVSGRGLGLVDAIATAWAAEHGADGTTVWFEIERSAG